MTAIAHGVPARARALASRHRSDLLLAVVVALVVVPVLQPLMAQQISRYALTAALTDGRTVVIEEYRHLIGVDRAERDGLLYSDKAPGQPVLAVPAYAAYRMLGGAPATAARSYGDLGLWSVSLVSAALPAIALAVLMRRFALRFAPERATEAALALSLGTMLLPFGTQLFSHVLSALCGLAAYLLASRGGRGALVAAGAMAGLAVTVEYTMGVLAVIVGVAVLLRGLRAHGLRPAGAAGAAWYALGGLPLAALLGWYHTAAFGGPLTVSYQYSQFAQHEQGIVGVGLPAPLMTLVVLFSERGLFVLTPVVLAGAIGLGVLLVRRTGPRTDLWVSAAVLVGFIWIMGSWDNPWAGASPGPRYIVPALPFLAGGVAYAWGRRPLLTAASALAGGLAMGIATFTLPLAQPTERSALLHWVDRARDGRWADTLLTGPLGDWAILLPLAAALALAVVLLRGEARARRCH